MDHLTREQFYAMAQRGKLVPVFRELAADLETPVSVYLKLRGCGASFLLESVEKAEQIGRYSFLGVNPKRQIRSRGRKVTIVDDGQGSYTYLRFDSYNESWATPHQEAELDDEVVADLDRDTFEKLLDRLQSWGCNLNVDLDYYDEFHEG